MNINKKTLTSQGQVNTKIKKALKKLKGQSPIDSDNFTMYIKYIYDDVNPQTIVLNNQLTDINGDPFDIQLGAIEGPVGWYSIPFLGAYYQGLEVDGNKIFVNVTAYLHSSGNVTNNITAEIYMGEPTILVIQTKELEDQLITPKFMSFELSVTIFKA